MKNIPQTDRINRTPQKGAELRPYKNVFLNLNHDEPSALSYKAAPQEIFSCGAAYRTRQTHGGSPPYTAGCGKKLICSAEFEHTVAEAVIHALLSYQVVMTAALDDLPVVQHHYCVGIAHCAEAMSDDKHGPSR